MRNPGIAGEFLRKAADRLQGSPGRRLNKARRYIDLYPLGRKFSAALAQTGASEEIAADDSMKSHNAVAAYRSFSKGRFTNRILYAGDRMRDYYGCALNRIHEGTHAMSFANAAAPYAVPRNIHSPVFLSPRDRLIEDELLELIAIAKSVEFKYFGHSSKNEAKALGKAKARLNRPDLALARNIAEFCLTQALYLWNKQYGNHSVTAADEYHARCLDSYERALEDYEGFMWWDDARRTFSFARLTMKDALEIGNTFGANFYAQCPDFARRILAGENFSHATQMAIEDLEERLGIQNHDALPTLDEALDKAGIGRAEFRATGRQEACYLPETAGRLFGRLWDAPVPER